MKKLFIACFIGLLLLLSFGCSSIPSGTEPIKEIQKNPAAKVGQEIVVVGMAETKTNMAAFKMFKIYQDNDYLWVTLPEGTDQPPQGINVRVTGPLQQKEFDLIGKVYYIEASKVRME
jgi:hypothetical protein